MSMNSVVDLRDTIVPKSDQLNAEQLLGGPITVTVTDVRRGGGEEQPVVIHYEGEGGRPYKPCKTMRKVLVFAWGPNGADWIGRSMTLYNRPDVKFGGEEVGGIRISHLSHIEKDVAVSLTATRGRKEQTRIKRLDDGPTVDDSRARLLAAARGGTKSLVAAWKIIPTPHKVALGGTQGCPDEYKQIAAGVDRTLPGESEPSQSTRTAAPGEIRFADVENDLKVAKDMDALDQAADFIRGIASKEDRAKLTELYKERADEIERNKYTP